MTSLIPSAKILAVLHGISLCIVEHIFLIVIFIDSVLAVRMLAGEKDLPGVLFSEMREVYDLTLDRFVMDVNHIYRYPNHVAYALAKLATCNDVYRLHMDLKFPPMAP